MSAISDDIVTIGVQLFLELKEPGVHEPQNKICIYCWAEHSQDDGQGQNGVESGCEYGYAPWKRERESQRERERESDMVQFLTVIRNLPMFGARQNNLVMMVELATVEMRFTMLSYLRHFSIACWWFCSSFRTKLMFWHQAAICRYERKRRKCALL